MEFGDFQTPLDLAKEVSLLVKSKLKTTPNTIVEPTCGYGHFIEGAYDVFKGKPFYKANEMNNTYLNIAKKKFKKSKIKITFSNRNFFEINWKYNLKYYKPPVLFIGNPPWVTNSLVGKINGKNLPQKSNIHFFSGLEAITGKSNFDISEAMIIQILLALQNNVGVVAMLCKTSVARKVIKFAQHNQLYFSHSSIYFIPSAKHFNVSVSACLFIFKVSPNMKFYDCRVYSNLQSKSSQKTIGFKNNIFLSDISACGKNESNLILGRKIWRSGLKHDCRKVMELSSSGKYYINGLDELVKIDSHYVYPLLKSSDIANDKTKNIQRFVIVTQTFLGENTQQIKTKSIKTWNYLIQHNSHFFNRKSGIYKGQPQFCMFGVGRYSFAPWKIAISGLYKKLNFCLVGPFKGKPVMLDDTCYFIPFNHFNHAQKVLKVLNSSVSKEVLNSLIFWDDKRPIKKSILDHLNIEQIGLEMGEKIFIPNENSLSVNNIKENSEIKNQLQFQL